MARAGRHALQGEEAGEVRGLEARGGQGHKLGDHRDRPIHQGGLGAGGGQEGERFKEAERGLGAEAVGPPAVKNHGCLAIPLA